MRFPGFIGATYKLSSVNIDAQRCVNLYPQINEVDKGAKGKSSEVMALLGTPGLTLLNTIGNGPIRGQHVGNDGNLYLVSGNKLYRVNSSFNETEIGVLETSSGNVGINDNGTTLIVVDGTYGYYHTMSSITTTKFSGTGWLGSTHVSILDGYAIFNDPNTQKFYITAINAITLDPLDFATANGSPDDIIAHQVNHRELWLFGKNSIEMWYNTGNADFPIERIGSGFLELGLAAAYSVAKLDKITIWMARNKDGQGIVYVAEGYNTLRVSNHAVEQAIQSYGDISDAIAWTYQMNGHSFYVLSFPTANHTWVYDLTTNLWHEWLYWNNGSYERHRGANHTFVYNKHVVGDYENGNIYELDPDVYSDNGNEIRAMRTAPHLSNDNKRIQYNSLRIDLETGIGLITGQGSDPKMMLQYSDDGGHTWSNERQVSIGKIGKFNTRAKFHKLGISRDRIYSISISDPVKRTIIGADIDFEILRD